MTVWKLGFFLYEQATAKKQTKRVKFLAEMETVVSWAALVHLIEPHYLKTSKKAERQLLDPRPNRSHRSDKPRPLRQVAAGNP
jgi:hypothetical protein